MCKLVELADYVRLKSANEIVKVIQRDLKDAYGNMGRIITLMKDEDLIKKGGNANYDLKGKSFLFYEPG